MDDSNESMPHRLGTPSLGANLLNGWSRTRDEIRRRLTRDLIVGFFLLIGAIVAVPVAIWSFRAEGTHRAQLDSAYVQAKRELDATKKQLEKAQPGVDRSLKFEKLSERAAIFLNNELQLLAASPERVVLNTITATAIQGKVTMRVSADAADKEQKRAYEARAAVGSNVLASFVTNVTLDRVLFPGGLRFDYVKIVEVNP